MLFVLFIFHKKERKEKWYGEYARTRDYANTKP